jgi:2,3-bisphosphoglycerate-dependent phosphoglycerate mutase
MTIDKKLYQAASKSLDKPGKSPQLPKKESKTDSVLYLFRHGETYDNKRRLFSGWRQSRLTKRGIKQAEILAKKLKNKRINMGIQSRLIRSKDTLKIILKYHPDAKIETDDRIIERCYGDLMGKSKLKMMKENPDLAVKYRRGYNFPPPHGESLKMVEKRVIPFCKELIIRLQKKKLNVAVSAHGNSMRAMRGFLEKMNKTELLTHENPLGEDYASYVIKVKSD